MNHCSMFIANRICPSAQKNVDELAESQMLAAVKLDTQERRRLGCSRVGVKV